MTNSKETLTQRRERFVRVCARRANRVVNNMRILKNCGNRMGYEYSEADVEKLFALLDKEVADLREAFAPKDTSEPAQLSFEG